MTPSDKQAEAVRDIVAWYKDPKGPQTYYLAGFAGTGKSFTANVAIEELRDRCGVDHVCAATYTGKAASVLRKKGVAGAQTIHSLIYRLVDTTAASPKFTLNLESEARHADLIVLDEVSMVDEETARDLRSFGCRILVMGDPGQLPPISGEGGFMDREPNFFLTEIHRQAADSPIIRIATMARNGEDIPLGLYGYGTKVEVLRENEILDAVDPAKTQVICGIHKVRWSMTQGMRWRKGHMASMPCAGEPIICRRNDRRLGVYNGQTGSVVACSGEPDSHMWDLKVDLDDAKHVRGTIRTASHLFRQHLEPDAKKHPFKFPVPEFDWGYVLTAHVAQGSEYPHVTVIDDSASFRANSRRWLYTAVTRASEGLVLIKKTGWGR